MFRDKAFLGYIKVLISKVLGIDEKSIDKLELAKDYLNENFDIKSSVGDIVYENKDMFINIEFNSVKSKNYELKNIKYVFHMVLNQIKSGDLEKVDRLKKTIQINLNSFDMYGLQELVYSSHIMEDEHHIIGNDYLEIYDIDLALASKLWYNKKEKKSLEYYLFAISSRDYDTKYEMYEGDELMEDVVSKMDKLKKDFNKDLFYDNEALLKKASYDKGKEEGGKDKVVAIAKKMIKEGFELEIISKITELPLEEIEKLK